MMSRRLFWISLASTAGMMLLPGLSEACPNCFSAVSTDGGTLGGGWAWSFFLLLAMPVALVGSIGGWIYGKYRKAEREHNERS